MVVWDRVRLFLTVSFLVSCLGVYGGDWKAGTRVQGSLLTEDFVTGAFGFREIDDVVFMFAEKARKEDKRLTFYEPEQAIPVMGDRDRLKQVIIIAIDNAMKYSESGGEIYVYTSVEGDSVTVGVRDHGCGIPADHLSKVKQKFYKANTEKGGFGIGLAVADEIIRKHNGEFIIDSVEGEGTNVSIVLPIARQTTSGAENITTESEVTDNE